MPCIDLRSFLSDTKSSECIGACVGRGIPTVENKGGKFTVSGLIKHISDTIANIFVKNSGDKLQGKNY